MSTAVTGQGHIAAATLTRPADTNVYTAGDVITDSTSAPTMMTFNAGAGPSQTLSMILNEVIVVDSANQTTKPDLELWLFHTAPAVQNDNAAFAPTDAELANLVALVTIPSTSFKVGNAAAGAPGNAVCVIQNIGTPITLPVNVTSSGRIFGFLVVRNAYTPVSGEIFTIRLKFLD